MRRSLHSIWEYMELAGLFLLQMMALGMWLVPLSRILISNGYPQLTAYAFATTAVAAFISPLVFGAMADRHVSPVTVLRGLSLAGAGAMGLVGFAIEKRYSPACVLVLIQLSAFFTVPTTSIASTIIFSRLQNSTLQFGAVRAAGTFGWMCGCWLISSFNFDSSARAAYADAMVWGCLALYTFILPGVTPPPAGTFRLRERMGWDALRLLKNRDHRVVFLTTALFSIPMAAFYPYAPPHLQQLGFKHTAAWMTLGQVTEIMAMLSLAGLILRWRLKWILAAGLFFGIMRYALSALNQPGWLLTGITLHGFSFTMFFTTAQIYLNERIEPAWRARAQALMSLMNSGVGSLVGYLGMGVWFKACTEGGRTRWPEFWGWLAVAMAAVFGFFLIAYHGQSSGFRRSSRGVSSGRV